MLARALEPSSLFTTTGSPLTVTQIYNALDFLSSMARLYKTIDSYHLSYQFVLELYKVVHKFPASEEHNITSQIKRAAVSISLNIVEGSNKASPKEFIHYLNTAFASAKEVEVLINLSKYLGFLSTRDFEFLAAKLDEICAKLFLFTRNIEQRISGRNPKFRFFQKFEENSNK
ncbi:four helix bundle protein [Candidatus Woesearchaeota archaeon]|nr:four helix bundle protein [Candidatus Woesearchaeota archaeon]